MREIRIKPREILKEKKKKQETREKVWETTYSDQWFQYFKPKESYGVEGYTNDR